MALIKIIIPDPVFADLSNIDYDIKIKSDGTSEFSTMIESEVLSKNMDIKEELLVLQSSIKNIDNVQLKKSYNSLLIKYQSNGKSR